MNKIPSKLIPALWIFGGLILLMAGIIIVQYYGTELLSPDHYVASTVVELLKSVGAALIVIGGINAIIETDHWRHYFEGRLKDIVLQQNYLDGLDEAVLNKLHIRLLQAQFKDSSIGGDDGFFSFYTKNIHQYIGGPYREDATGDITITETNGDLPWNVSETIRFTCRKNGGKIQDSISWGPDGSQILDSLRITVQLPAGGPENTIFESSSNGDLNGLNPTELQKLKSGISLRSVIIDNIRQDLSTCDRLIVAIEAKYRLRKSSAVTWSFVLPTRRFHLTVMSDPRYEMMHELFAANEDGAKCVRAFGSLSLHYNDWMLPQNGVVIRLFPKQADVIEPR